MDENTKFVSGKDRNQLVKFITDKHANLMRPLARYYSALKDAMVSGKRRYTLVKDVDDMETGAYDKPLPCFGCGIGWFSFLLGFVCPLLWYYATFLYFGNYYRRDPRERAGLAASAITAMGFSLVLLVILALRWF
uniref:60S ribosomal protein L18a-like protein n=1 Tax=Noccaea caerulescens TaxID=107243 RepID=A0A1J3I2F3_NOCCA